MLKLELKIQSTHTLRSECFLLRSGVVSEQFSVVWRRLFLLLHRRVEMLTGVRGGRVAGKADSSSTMRHGKRRPRNELRNKSQIVKERAKRAAKKSYQLHRTEQRRKRKGAKPGFRRNRKQWKKERMNSAACCVSRSALFVGPDDNGVMCRSVSAT